MKKLFGEIDLTWKKLIILAIIAGLYTGVVAIIPAFADTSLRDISITFERWVLFGILIIMNSKSPKDSALKCFIFFLISQPLVYLVQVPYNPYGWGIFRYYPGWFIWTLFTLPMGFIGYYMKKDKWYSVVILAPMLLFVGYHYMGFANEAYSFFPNHLYSSIFCIATLIIYPLFIYKNKKNKYIALSISIIIILVTSIIAFATPKSFYNTTVLSNSETVPFDDTYSVRLKDEEYGRVYIGYENGIEDYMVYAEFSKTGETELILESPDGQIREFYLTIGRSTYDIIEKTEE